MKSFVSHLGYITMSGDTQPTFWKNISTPSSGLKSKEPIWSRQEGELFLLFDPDVGYMCLRNVGPRRKLFSMSLCIYCLSSIPPTHLSCTRTRASAGMLTSLKHAVSVFGPNGLYSSHLSFRFFDNHCNKNYVTLDHCLWIQFDNSSSASSRWIISTHFHKLFQDSEDRGIVNLRNVLNTPQKTQEQN